MGNLVSENAQNAAMRASLKEQYKNLNLANQIILHENSTPKSQNQEPSKQAELRLNIQEFIRKPA